MSSLERVGIGPKVAQKLARHSDIRLTLGVYTHAELTPTMDALPGAPATWSCEHSMLAAG